MVEQLSQSFTSRSTGSEKFQIGGGRVASNKLDGGAQHAMELEWPRLAPDTLVCFQRFFRSPLQLDAAFDNDLESLELTQSIFPDMVAEDVMDVVAVLMVWKESGDRSFNVLVVKLLIRPCSCHLVLVQCQCKMFTSSFLRRMF
jgi:hypothetical protein